jgi:hypothetical protein
MADAETDAPRGGLRLNRDVSVGQLLTMIPTLSLLVAVVVFAVNVANSAKEASTRVDDLKTDVQRQFSDMRQSLTFGLAGVQAQIANLPDMSARVGAIERKNLEFERHLSALDGRLDDVNKLIWQTNAELVAIQKASSRR